MTFEFPSQRTDAEAQSEAELCFLLAPLCLSRSLASLLTTIHYPVATRDNPLATAVRPLFTTLRRINAPHHEMDS